MDEEISISPTSGASRKTPADILAGAERAREDREAAAAPDFDAVALEVRAGSAASPVRWPRTRRHRAASADRRRKGRGGETCGEAARFDLDFKLDDADKPAPMGRPRVEPVLETAARGQRAAPQLTRPAAALELDKLDLSFDPERSTFEDPTPSVLDGQWHDAATKLDLAKAYQEMGDVEGAREILQEVLHEGDDQQKAEAKALLAKLT